MLAVVPTLPVEHNRQKIPESVQLLLAATTDKLQKNAASSHTSNFLLLVQGFSHDLQDCLSDLPMMTNYLDMKRIRSAKGCFSISWCALKLRSFVYLRTLLQRLRFSTSVLFTASVSLEFLTPLMPQYFLPLASLANVGKSMGLTTYIATQPVFLKSFTRSENLADINAKSQVGG